MSDDNRKRAGSGSGGRHGPKKQGSGPSRGNSSKGRGGERGRGGDRSHRQDRQRGGASTGRQPQLKDPRAVALDLLTSVRERGAYANLELPSLLRKAKLDERDTSLATELSYGTTRAQGQLDRIIAKAAGRSPAKIDAEALDVLRLGAYQLLYTRVAQHAAVDTTVELAKREGLIRAAGFINAVMHKITAHDLAGWTQILQQGITDPFERMAIGTAHPEWIVRAFANALGKDAAELPQLLAADDARPKVHLAARPGAITAEELALITGGDEAELSPYAVHLPSGSPGELEPVKEHLAAVQDEGSQLVALAAANMPLEGEDSGRWLDLCAGPGGKATMLGALADIAGAEVTAIEVAAHRAKLVEGATDGLPVRVKVADGRKPGLEPGFDRVLVDAPCTGLGALRRRPESRWRRSPDDVTELTALQKELLASALELVRPGGVVVYATCSPHLPETVSVVNDAVRRHSAELLDVREGLPEALAGEEGPWVQLWPHRHGTDAMFMCALRRSDA
ncbi:RsmB/NOP family class I SAM-dependent RNA methyltransferase [Dietzia timorensis]|uniref:Putative methyltransferase n=1 Tax=Dietzia timorensis TaxID=499555 RepID=A0A173LLA4_9ACTN|nr:transcription antitermination factor NusB [Dietzia timorensis]ANI92489.1 Putative methyltransferase [Dietzia timorensis]